MKVLLKRNWFNPKGYRMRVEGAGTVHECPEEWRDLLPSTAVILDDEAAPVVPLEVADDGPDTFSEMMKMEEMKIPTAESIAQETHEQIETARKEQIKRNRQAGMKRAREAKAAQKEKDNVQVD